MLSTLPLVAHSPCRSLLLPRSPLRRRRALSRDLDDAPPAPCAPSSSAHNAHTITIDEAETNLFETCKVQQIVRFLRILDTYLVRQTRLRNSS